MSPKLIPAQIALRKYATPENKKINEWFFKTGPGQYGFGDQFIGVKVPKTRSVAKTFSDITLAEIKTLLESPIHEDRSLALMILRPQYERAVRLEDQEKQKTIYEFLMKNKSRINNWDLVDGSAPYITGHYAYQYPSQRKKLFGLIHSKNMWDRRIAMISTYYFIRQNRFVETIQMATALLKDEEDLMHKASGWMLREMGKKDLKPLHAFLKKYAHVMPRTMLRYSIEKLSIQERKYYMGLKQARAAKI